MNSLTEVTPVINEKYNQYLIKRFGYIFFISFDISVIFSSFTLYSYFLFATSKLSFYSYSLFSYSESLSSTDIVIFFTSTRPTSGFSTFSSFLPYFFFSFFFSFFFTWVCSPVFFFFLKIINLMKGKIDLRNPLIS